MSKFTIFSLNLCPKQSTIAQCFNPHNGRGGEGGAGLNEDHNLFAILSATKYDEIYKIELKSNIYFYLFWSTFYKKNQAKIYNLHLPPPLHNNIYIFVCTALFCTGVMCRICSDSRVVLGSIRPVCIAILYRQSF